MIFPRPLQKGDCVGLIAPSSSITPEEHVLCVKILEEKGYKVIEGKTLKNNISLYGYLAGDAKERADDMNEMFANTKVKAIFCTRGGYGSAELLDYLDYEMIRKNPKIFVGYSDITSIHMVLQKYCKLITFHGPMIKSDLLTITEEIEEDIIKRIKREADYIYMMESLHAAYNIKKFSVFKNAPGQELQVVKDGYAKGRLVGGNLSVLVRSLGTPYAPDFKGKILFLEDVGESIPKVHMYLLQMYQAGIFKEITGILLGDFTECTNKEFDNHTKVQEFLKEWFLRLEIPVIQNVTSDHRFPMGTLPLGAWCEMRATTYEKGIFFFRDREIN